MESGSTPPAVPLLGTTLEDALDAGMRKAGVFCSLCGRSAPAKPEPPKLGDLKPGEGTTWIDGGPPTMTEYLVIDAQISPNPGEKPSVNLARFYHCGREDCDAAELRASAQATRSVPAWEVLSPAEEKEEQPETEDPPPAKFKRGEHVLLTGRLDAVVVMSTAYFRPDDDGPAGWRYALSEDGTAVKALPLNPYLETVLQSAEASA
jgi:hypothetical protein